MGRFSGGRSKSDVVLIVEVMFWLEYVVETPYEAGILALVWWDFWHLLLFCAEQASKINRCPRSPAAGDLTS